VPIGKLETEGDLKRWLERELDADNLQDTLLDALVPTAVILPTGATSAPDGFLLCDGSEVSTTTYATLFAAIGTAFNTGGEAGGNFRVPDMKGKVPVGRDAGQVEFDVLGESGGAKTHTLTEAELAAHTHIDAGVTITSIGSGGSGATSGRVAGWATGQPTGSAGSNGAHNNLQPYQVINYIIKT